MGHIGAKISIVPLIDRLNKYPIGLVDNEKLREILSFLFSEEEAFIASKFPLEEATLNELHRATGVDGEKLLPLLERMADKGLVMDLPYNGTTYYLLVPGLIGFMEFTFMKNRSDLPLDRLAKLMTEYLHDASDKAMATEFFGSKTQLTRTLVYEDKIPVTSEITSYENAREILKNSSYRAVTMCYCRHKKEHMNKKCKKGAPVEGVCMVLGSGARFLVRRGFAEEKSIDEMLAILDSAREFNLTHVTDNIRNKPSFICNCCRCCCELMVGVQMGFHDGIAKTAFLAKIDAEKCDYCGKCMAECNVKAIKSAKMQTNGNGSKRHAVVGDEICLGCAACIPTCEQGAIELIPRAKKTVPPSRKKNMYMRILWEKGRLMPFLKSQFKKKLLNIFR